MQRNPTALSSDRHPEHRPQITISSMEQTLEGSSSSSPPFPPSCNCKRQLFPAFDEMGGTGKNEPGNGYGAPRLQKRSFSTVTNSQESSHAQIRDLSINKLSVPWKEKSSIGQYSLLSQIDRPQVPNNHVNSHYTGHSSLGSRPLRTIPTGHIPESSISPHTSMESGKRISSSQSEVEDAEVPTNPLTEWLNSTVHEIDTSLEYQLAQNSVESEAATNIPVPLCPANAHEQTEDFIVPMVRYLPLKTEVKATSLANELYQKEILSKSNTLMKEELVDDVDKADLPHSQTIIPSREAIDSKCWQIRRARITEGINLLKNSVPCSDKASRASVLDDAIDYIKFLKLQLKILGQSRLGGEPTPHPFVYLEGYGHYLYDHLLGRDSLEDVMGQLMTTNMQAANELLEKKGLAVLPMDLVHTFQIS